MRSLATRRFWELFQTLPKETQNLVFRNFGLWRRDPRHPLLRLRRLPGSDDRFSIRATDGYCALGVQTDEETIWIWIGTHADYDRLVGL